MSAAADPATDARRAAEQAARASYGRLVAILATRTRDLAAAEDALAEAFRAALDTWPRAGVPDRPEAWLLTVARRGLDRAWRRSRTQAAVEDTLATLAEPTSRGPGDVAFPDERLKLLFACTHPAVDPSVQAPLMMQVVLGLEATHIAAAFLVSPAAMGQRLARGKAKIRDAGIAFEVPDADALPAREQAVLSALYAAYGAAWKDVHGEDAKLKGLSEEAIWLTRTLVGLLPASAEAKGLLALMLYCEARRVARRDPAACFVPLDRQDVQAWSRPMIAEAEGLLRAAAPLATLGRFQLEAAIQSFHVERRLAGRTSWQPLLTLYDLLVGVAPGLGTEVARAAAIAEAAEPDRALLVLDALAPRVSGYQPYWAARGRALALVGRVDAARAAYRQAAGLTEDSAMRAFLLEAGGDAGPNSAE